MKAIFVNENGCIRYAEAIVGGYKTIETRSRDMLRSLVGERVAIVRTRREKNPMVYGYVDIVGKTFIKKEDFADLFPLHLVPPKSSRDCTGRGKWGYILENAEKCDPYPLPSNAVRHGRSWGEF